MCFLEEKKIPLLRPSVVHSVLGSHWQMILLLFPPGVVSLLK